MKRKDEARRGRPKTHDQQAVLETAMTAYWQADAAAVSVNEICRLAGVAKPSLYRSFGSEDGLTLAVLDRYAELVLGRLEAMLSSEASVSGMLDTLIHIASDEPQMESGCLFVKMRSARSRFGAQTQARIADIESHLHRLFARLLREGEAGGDRKARVPADLAARYVQEQLGLAMTQRAAGRSRKSVRQLMTLALSVLRELPEGP